MQNKKIPTKTRKLTLFQSQFCKYRSISDQKPQNNHKGGGIFFNFDADLLFFSKLTVAVLLSLSLSHLSPHDSLPFSICMSALIISSLLYPTQNAPWHPPPPPSLPVVCKVGFYRSLLESLACSKCPPHSMARQTGATALSLTCALSLAGGNTPTRPN